MGLVRESLDVKHILQHSLVVLEKRGIPGVEKVIYESNVLEKDEGIDDPINLYTKSPAEEIQRALSAERYIKFTSRYKKLSFRV